MYLKNIEKGERVQWHSYVWNTLTIPKHRFILWLAAIDKLKTETRLDRMGIFATDCLCPFCGLTPETVNHLFFVGVLPHY